MHLCYSCGANHVGLDNGESVARQPRGTPVSTYRQKKKTDHFTLRISSLVGDIVTGIMFELSKTT